MSDINTSHAAFLKRFSSALSIIVAATGVLVLLAWKLDPPFLKNISPDAVSINPMTALCFILSGLSLVLLDRARSSRWGRALGGGVLLIGFFKLCEYVLGWHSGIDLSLFREKLLTDQLAPNTALNFFLTGFALVILDNPTSRKYHPSELLLLTVVLTSFFAAMGYVYNVSSVTRIEPFYIAMSLNTALSFLLLCLAAFCSRPGHGLMKILSGEGLGSVTIRRLLPVSIILPALLSVLNLQGQKAGLYGIELGVAIYTTSVAVIFALVIWFNAQLLNQMDLKRKLAEEKTLEAAKVKSEFTSMVSHELRTPLTVIKESVAIVYDGSAGAINADQKDFLETAKRNVDRLGRLINDVLDYQKLEAQHVEFRMVEQDINKVIAEIGQSFELPLKSKGLKLRLNLRSGLPLLVFDTDKIIQVLINLTNNAMKFTEKGTITLASEMSGDNAVKVSVTDEGMGIKKEDLGKLFQSFSQISTGTGRQTGSTGLGLAISKKIIDNHKGQMQVSSVYGQGSTFYFILPVKGHGA
jgi:signal transduction histidine kinase